MTIYNLGKIMLKSDHSWYVNNDVYSRELKAPIGVVVNYPTSDFNPTFNSSFNYPLYHSH